MDRKHSPFSIDELAYLQKLGNRSECRNHRLKKALKFDNQLNWSAKSKLISAREIDRVSTTLQIPERARKLAKKVYSRAKDNDLIVGRSIKGMAVAALYYACRFHQLVHSLDKLAVAGDQDIDELKACFIKLAKNLKLTCPPRNLSTSIEQYGNQFGLSHEVKQKAIMIMNMYQKEYTLSGKSPKGIIAASIYQAVSLSESSFLSQKKISEKMGISSVTLRARLKEIIALSKKKETTPYTMLMQ